MTVSGGRRAAATAGHPVAPSRSRRHVNHLLAKTGLRHRAQLLGYAFRNGLVDELKVDRSFIVRMGDSPAHVTIVAAVATIARSLDLTVVGEGIEDLATAERLRDLGFHLLQDYHFGRPQPPAELVLPADVPATSVATN